jgi:hypothetical protein
MDCLFQSLSLDTLKEERHHSVKLTGIVNNILMGVMPTITHEDAMACCKKLMVGDDNMPSVNQKSLPYVARMCMGNPPVWRVVVTVAQVTNNLKDILVNRAKMYEQLQVLKNPIFMLSVCLKMIMSDPRQYNMSTTTQFTYMKKSDKPSTKRGESTRDESDGELSPKRTKIHHDILEGAENLFILKTSPPRARSHISPRSRNIPTGSSVMSEGDDVMSMSNTGHSEATRTMEEFYSSKGSQ